MITIDNKHDFEDIVFLKTDPEQHERLVHGIIICPNNQLLYDLMCGTVSSRHYDIEICKEKKALRNSVTGYNGKIN